MAGALPLEMVEVEGYAIHIRASAKLGRWAGLKYHFNHLFRKRVGHQGN